ncbi:MAG: hypothetical protein AAF081_15595 [Actinomycetota bacterium]
MTMSDAREPDDERSALPAVAENTLASVEAIQPRIDAYVDRLESEVASALQDAYHLLADHRRRQETAIAELMVRANAEIERVVGRIPPALPAELPTPAVPTLPPAPADAVGAVPASEPPTIDLRDGAVDIWQDAARFDEHFDRFWSEAPPPAPAAVVDGPVPPGAPSAEPVDEIEPELAPVSPATWRASLVTGLRDIAVPVLLAIVVIPTVLALGLAFLAN